MPRTVTSLSHLPILKAEQLLAFRNCRFRVTHRLQLKVASWLVGIQRVEAKLLRRSVHPASPARQSWPLHNNTKILPAIMAWTTQQHIALFLPVDDADAVGWGW